MVIIAIGALLMAPNIGPMLTNYRLRTASRDIVSTMRTAQMKAVSTNMEYRVSFDLNAQTYILQRNTGGWQSEGVTQSLPTGIQISAIFFPGNNAQFNTNSTASTGSLTLRNSKGRTTRITVTASTGRIKIE
jgi:type II secretory pathway pseudopilin PulG